MGDFNSNNAVDMSEYKETFAEIAAAVDEVRSFDTVRLSYLGLGLVVGGVVGGVVGYFLTRNKLETKYSEIAAEEIAEMRQHYNDKATAVALSQEKGKLEDLVRERGYSKDTVEPPMAITPPATVVRAAKDFSESEDDEDTGELPVEEDELSHISDPAVRNVFRDTKIDDDWDWHKERRKRSPLRPYIIHTEERDEQQAYDCVTWTYYEADDVLCNEADEVLDEVERDTIIGEAHLSQFGHGSRDRNIVYVRNDQLEMDMEIVRSPNSYAEEVHGFDPPEIQHSYRREKRAFDDE